MGTKVYLEKLGDLYLPFFPSFLYTLSTPFLFLNWLEYGTNVCIFTGWLLNMGLYQFLILKVLSCKKHYNERDCITVFILLLTSYRTKNISQPFIFPFMELLLYLTVYGMIANNGKMLYFR